MKQYIKITLTVLITLICVFQLAGCSSSNKYVIDARDQNVQADENASDLSNTFSQNGFDDFSESNISTSVLDPFEGLVIDFDGISPFCTISFNNSRCSEEVQLNVDYSLSPDIVTIDGYFSINEDVTVYALLKNQYDAKQSYSLSQTQQTYTVEDVPQYITEITADMDFTQFKQEAEDYLESITAFAVGDYIWSSWGTGNYADSTKPLRNMVYFSSLKMSSYDKFSNNCFNKIDITYSIGIMDQNSNDYQNRYFTIIAKNIIQYPDGTIGWGANNPADLNFEHNIDWSNMESLINSNITSNKADYNVTDITDYVK